MRLARIVACATGATLLMGAPTASAHPLGNFSVNHAHALTVSPSGVVDRAVIDFAEIPTTQNSGAVDTDGNGDVEQDELDRRGVESCAALRSDLSLSIGGSPVEFVVTNTSFTYHEGQAGLPTSRLECELTATHEIHSPTTIELVDDHLPDRVGWHEIVAVGDGVGLVDSPVPTISSTDSLRVYPNDLLSSPLDVRSVRIDAAPGATSSGATSSTASGVPRSQEASAGTALVRGGPLADAVDRVTREFDELLGRRDLTLGVGTLAVLLAMVLGASHALLPGHGKTVMAAYIAGRQGTARDAVLVGATVTGTHTGGVLLLGLALTLSTSLAGETVLGWLGVASGLMIAVLGIGLLWSAVRRRPGAMHGHHHGHHVHSHDHHDHDHHDHDHHDHDHHHHDHGHSHGHHDHDHHDHSHSHGEIDRRVSRRGLIGMGVAGGLVPSPSALIVLLSAIALGRTAFGVVLVIGYGLGMASMLTLAGLLLVRVRDRYRARTAGSPVRALGRIGRRWSILAAPATATLVVVVGLGVAVRGLSLV